MCSLPHPPSRVTRMDFSAEITFLVSERIQREVKSAINGVKSPARPTICSFMRVYFVFYVR